MRIREKPFNLNLILILPAVLVSLFGCKSPERERKKELSTFRVHIESNHVTTNRTEVVRIFRDLPTNLLIDKAPFITEGEVTQAEVVDAPGGFQLQIHFNRQGRALLEEYTASYPGRRLVIFAQFTPEPGGHMNEGRWLAAPRIRERISTGVLTFTPDASREECQQLVQGLNNVARQLQNTKK